MAASAIAKNTVVCEGNTRGPIVDAQGLASILDFINANFAQLFPTIANYTTTGTTSGTPMAGRINLVANANTAVSHFLPDATTVPVGIPYTVKKTDTGTGVITVKSAGGTIDSVAAATGVAMTASARTVFIAVSDGTDWHILKNTATA